MSKTDEALNPATYEPTPETFDIDEWLDDAHLPESLVTIYKHGNLLSRIEQLQEEIAEESQLQANGGGTIAEGAKLAKLQREYDAALEDFSNSKLTVYVQALPSSVKRKLAAEKEELEAKLIDSGKEKRAANVEASEEFMLALIGAAVVGVAGPDGKRKDQSGWTADQVRRIEDRLGPGTRDMLIDAKKRAEAHVKEPSADFLHTLSGTNSQNTDS